MTMAELDREILARRPSKHSVDPHRPYAFLVEPEPQPSGLLESVAVVFLTNRECPYRCLMCDLWKHTTDEPVPVGAIPQQIDYALQRLPAASHLKLYNAGSFFDPLAISPVDYPAIIEQVCNFDSLIVENHPNLLGSRADAFHRSLQQAAPEIRFEIAMGLETCHPESLQKLNKRMTLADFDQACRFLRERGIAIRVFVLLRAPGLNEQEGLYWAKRSVEYAFDQGAGIVSIIPTRIGNGMLDHLQQQGTVGEPSLASMEAILEWGIQLRHGRVLIDLWDAERFVKYESKAVERMARLKQMNLTQQMVPPVQASCHVPTSLERRTGDGSR